MTLRFRQLRLRAVTTDGVYGTDIAFQAGLNVLWADNTKGKSTCMQAMLYALGLEKMLSPRREIPLPHAMTSYLSTDDSIRKEVLESSVAIELENGLGQIITVTRAVKAVTDTRLVSVDFGAALTNVKAQFRRQNFFVLDAGAAQRADGFHHFLEGFLGWQLPLVRRYDSPEGKLYLETVFPVFWVEQKFGWSAIPAAIPTYMRIREVHKRAVEFIMDLDVHKLELLREQLAERINLNAKEWSATRDEINRFVSRAGGRIAALSEGPVADPELLKPAHIQIAENAEWTALSLVASKYKALAASLASASIPAVEDQSGAVGERLRVLSEKIDSLNTRKISLHSIEQLKAADMHSLQRRIDTLADDLAKNLDVQKIQRYSGITAALTPDRCPTCEQALSDTLLSQEALSQVMPVADNIQYIRSQKKMFEDILAREKLEEGRRCDEISATNKELSDYYSQVRLLKSELIAPGSNPSAAVIEDRLRAEAKVRELEGLQSVFEGAMDRLESLQKAYTTLLAERELMPTEKLSENDKDKLRLLTDLLQRQASEFAFSTFSPMDLSISEDSYRPEKEGFEIGFETSASDAIRLKWAYQLSLLELAHEKPTNHPQLLVFDEPRQQSSSKVSFKSLLKRASESKRHNQQVIFSTSEDLDTLTHITKELDCNEVVFPGYILQKIN